MVPSTPLKECSSSLPAHSQIYFLQKGVWLQHSGGSDLSLPDLFYWAGLNCPSWRAPQEAPWLAVLSLWPRSGSPWPLLTGWSLSLYNDFQIQQQQLTPHIAAEMCEMTKINNDNNLLQQLEVMENLCHQGQGLTPFLFLPSGSRYLCDNSIYTIDSCPLLLPKWHFKSYTKNLKTLHL